MVVLGGEDDDGLVRPARPYLGHHLLAISCRAAGEDDDDTGIGLVKGVDRIRSKSPEVGVADNLVTEAVRQ